MTDDIRVARAVADSFGLGRPTGALVAGSHRSSETWRLDTVDGRVLVKRVEVAGRTAEVERASAFERRVAERGVAIPHPLVPAGDAVGLVAFVDGLGHVRCSEWVDGRDLADDDDVAHWLGRTLAAIHAIEPVPAAEPVIYGVHPVEQWHVWLDAGERLGRPWVAMLKDRLALLIEITEWIVAALDRSSDYVLSHRDIEPWNVMVTADGPVLVDWDMAGPDSASLETGHAAFAFATRGGLDHLEDDLTATFEAYLDAGGRLRSDPDLLARRVGMRLEPVVLAVVDVDRSRAAGAVEPSRCRDAGGRADRVLARVPTAALRPRPRHRRPPLTSPHAGTHPRVSRDHSPEAQLVQQSVVTRTGAGSSPAGRARPGYAGSNPASHPVGAPTLESRACL